MVLITWLCEFNKLNSFWLLWKKVRVQGNHKILLFSFKKKKKNFLLVALYKGIHVCTSFRNRNG